MKASEFEYACPLTLDDALMCLSSTDYDCQLLAGGQSLMPMINLRLARPEMIVDLNKISELDFIRVEEQRVVIGSMVRYTALMNSSIVNQHIPLFSQALPHIAHKAVRNRGTIGGSVALADPAAEMPALLQALDATIVVMSTNGSREIAASDFFTGLYETSLQRGEMVHSINVPVAGEGQRFGFYEQARRHGDYAMAGVAISAASVEPYINLRIVFFSISDRALRATEAETVLEGNKYNEALINKAKQANSVLPFNEDMNATEPVKLHLSGIVMQRALAGMNRENY